MAKKAIGERGSWFASVDGERLPCVHKYLFKNYRYRALRAYNADPKHIELVAAIRDKGKVILTTDDVIGDSESYQRTGYVAVYRVDDVVWENDILEFRFVEKLGELK